MCLTREQGMTIKNKPERKREQMEVERESGAGRPVSPTPTRAATAHSSRSSRQQQRRLHPRGMLSISYNPDQSVLLYSIF